MCNILHRYANVIKRIRWGHGKMLTFANHLPFSRSLSVEKGKKNRKWRAGQRLLWNYISSKCRLPFHAFQRCWLYQYDEKKKKIIIHRGKTHTHTLTQKFIWIFWNSEERKKKRSVYVCLGDWWHERKNFRIIAVFFLLRVYLCSKVIKIWKEKQGEQRWEKRTSPDALPINHMYSICPLNGKNNIYKKCPFERKL